MEEIKYKICGRCEQEKATSDFYKSSYTKDHLCYYCRSCAKAKDKESQERNREKFLKENDGLHITKKICKRCNQEKEISNFCKMRLSPDHFHYYCRECQAISLKEYRARNYKKANEDAARYKRENKEKIKITYKRYRQKNAEQVLEREIRWRKNNEEKLRQITRDYSRNRKRTDPVYKLTATLRSRLWSALKGQNAVKSDKTIALIGCSYQELRSHLESQFTEGMTWENYGREGWEVDHIRPCASFDLSDPKQQEECFHYSNMQPLWREENRNKSSYFEGKRIRTIR